jgi:hypothetical protein
MLRAAERLQIFVGAIRVCLSTAVLVGLACILEIAAYISDLPPATDQLPHSHSMINDADFLSELELGRYPTRHRTMPCQIPCWIRAGISQQPQIGDSGFC